MRRRTWAAMLVVCGTVAVLPACHGAPKEAAATRAAEPVGEPGQYLADFDTAWELVRDTHYDTAYNGVDWDGVRTELRPLAEQARTRGQSRALIQDMVSRLNQSHFGVIPEGIDRDPASSDPTDTADPAHSDDDNLADASPAEVPARGDGEGDAAPGLDFRIVDGRALVTGVHPGGPADEAGVRAGWVLTHVRRTDIGEVIARMSESLGGHEASLYTWQAVAQRLQGAPGSSVALTFLNADDHEVTLDIARVDPPGEMVKFGNLPPLSTRLNHRWLTADETGDPDARVGYIAFNIFMIPIAPQFERAMVELQDADGVIIDLRGNPGGIGGMAGALARFFVSEKSRLGTMHMRGQDLQFNAEPVVVTSRGERLRPFKGPLAVVIDETSASTSEVFAGGLRAIGRARTFGSPSAGMALPAAMTRLPSGDVLLHAIADYLNSDGTRLEGDGVPTDESVPVRREDLLAGVDAPLREAARWIVSETAGADNAAPANN
jgi:carboxyl-terminal processing protease